MRTRADRGRLSETLRPAVFGAGFFGPTMQVFDVLLFGEVWSWWETAARSVFYAVGVGLFSVAALRFSATAREQVTVGRAITTGVLPEDADRDWRERLTAERRRLDSTRTVLPSLSGLAAVLVAVVTLLPRGSGGGGWVLAAGLAVAGGFLAVRERRRLQTAERLLAELGEAPVAGGESAHVGDRPTSA